MFKRKFKLKRRKDYEGEDDCSGGFLTERKTKHGNYTNTHKRKI